MLRDLVAADSLAETLTAMAPLAVAAAGGGQAIVARFGTRTGAKFWSLEPMPEDLWEAVASESQASFRELPAPSD